VVKTRVHDLAAEFGVAPEQLLQMLRDMNIFVRSHLSALETDQVSAIRVRWEREKRKHAEEAQPKKTRRKAVKAAEPAPPVPAEVKPGKRRRTAAEVAQVEAAAALEREAAEAAERAALELERPVLEIPEPQPLPSLEERARALFKDLPPLPVEEELPPATEVPAPVESAAAPPAPPIPTRAPFIPPRIQRPAPAGPSGPGRGAPPQRAGYQGGRPKPVFSSGAPAAPARPGAPGAGAPARTFGPDAEKGGGRKKGKKGKRASVDQDAVQANILRTLQGMKGPGRKGVRRPDEPSFRELQAGRLAEEIVAVSVPSRKGDPVVVDRDEHPRATTPEALAKLKPIVRADGTVTAGNASGVNDGACATIVASDVAARRHGLTPRARIVASAVAGVAPRIMGFGPAPATRKVLALAGLTLRDLDVIELNEAFAAQALAVTRDLGLPDDASHVNPNGGAIAIGHPLGASGARLATTASYELARRKGRYALATMCIGVGQGIAMILERV